MAGEERGRRGSPRAVLSSGGRTCRCSDTSESIPHWTTQRTLRERRAGGWRGPRRGRAPAVPTAALPGDGTWRRMEEVGECRPSPGAGGGRGERALTAVVGQHGAVPPSGTIPRYLTGTVALASRPLPDLALCGERGVQKHGPAVPQPPPSSLPPTPHLFTLLEPNPDGLHTLVVGDGSPQGGCLAAVLHPRQVGAFLDLLAPTLQGELSVPGHLRETGVPVPLGTPVALPQPRPSSGNP